MNDPSQDRQGKDANALLGLFLSSEQCSSNGASGNDVGGIWEISFRHPLRMGEELLRLPFLEPLLLATSSLMCKGRDHEYFLL